MEGLPLTREEAIEFGHVCYFNGVPCKSGHIDKIYTFTNLCYQCKRDRNNKDYQKYSDRIKDCCNKSRKRNWERVLRKSREWTAKNPEKSKDIKNRNREKYKEKYNTLAAERNRIKRQKDPIYRMNRNLSKAIWENLKDRGTSKKGKRWLELVKFTIPELIAHLESKFIDDMSWDNYGKRWVIDHIKPLSKCDSFEESWALTNLQPLDFIENLRKNNKYPYDRKID